MSTTSAFGQSTPSGTLGASGSSIIKPASGAFGAFTGAVASPFGAGSTPSTNATGNGGGFSSFAGQSRSLWSMDGTDSFGTPMAQTTGTTSSAFGSSSIFGQPQQQPAENVFSSLANKGNTGSVFGSFGTPATQPLGGNGQTMFGGTNMESSQQKQQQVSVFGQPSQMTTTPSSSQLPSISMALSNSGGSTFPAASPMSAFPPSAQFQGSERLTSQGTTIDFASAIAGTTYRPDSTPYDSELPQNYAALLPARVMEAFKKEKFGWWWKDDEAAAVPEWVPPVDVR